jgi:hypothetical protein
MVVGGLGMMAYSLYAMGKRIVKMGNLAALTVGLKASLDDVVKASREKDGDNWKEVARTELRSTWELATADLEHNAAFFQVQTRLHTWIDENLDRIEAETQPAEDSANKE